MKNAAAGAALMGLGMVGLIGLAVSMSGEDEGVPEIRAAPGDPALPPAPRTSSGAAPVVSGVTFSSGIVITPLMITFLREFRRRVPAGVPIHVTSGMRTAERQANAMLNKIKRGENLYNLYVQDDLVAEVMKVSPSEAAMTSVLKAQMARGRYLSNHMTGHALDFRTRADGKPFWTPEQYNIIVQTARGMGLETLLESDHLHMEELDRWKPPGVAGATLGGVGRSVRPRPARPGPRPGAPGRRPPVPPARRSA